jgi:type VI secretion system protein ImpG
MSDNDPLLKYFEDEMRYLRAAGDEFAAQHPEAARRLGLSTVGARDDSVEQVFEGFAFLTARLRMKLDDALPEITEPLIDDLWPHAAHTIPSLAMLECVPRTGEARALGTLPAGLRVRSTPVDPNGAVCVYRTTQPVRLLPLEVREAALSVRADGRTAIRIAFDLLHLEQRTPDDLSCIRLYLHGERRVASALYAALTRQIDTIGVRMPTLMDGELHMQPGMYVNAAGFGPGTRLWPSTDAQRDLALDREQTMLEYFAFPEKFHFVDLCGFDATSVPAGETCIEFEIVLDRPRASDLSAASFGSLTFDRSNIRLFCTPVINLFEIDAKPLRPSVHGRDYLVEAPDAAGTHVEPYEAVSVAATDRESGERYVYQPFRSLRHRGGLQRDELPERYFHTSTRAGVMGTAQMWITLGGPAWDEPGSVPDAHITVRVLANNGTLPRMALAESGLAEPVSDFGGIRSVRNLTSPTTPLYPPRGEPYDWQAISHFQGRELSMLDAQVLRAALGLYDWTGHEANAKRIQAIQRVSRFGKRTVSRGAVLRIIQIRVELDAAGFAGPGDMVLFGEILNHFVGRYADSHTAVQLVLVADGRETVFRHTEFDGAPF